MPTLKCERLPHILKIYQRLIIEMGMSKMFKISFFVYKSKLVDDNLTLYNHNI